MGLLCQLQADVSRVPVRRAAVRETTALGVAFLAGLAEDVWDTPNAIATAWRSDASFAPTGTAAEIARRHADWLRGVERARGWATEASGEQP
jgi:glycerol kinase